MQVDVTFTLHCSLRGCGATVRQCFASLPLTLGSQLPWPQHPVGWRLINDLWLCDKHTVQLHVDDEVSRGYT